MYTHFVVVIVNDDHEFALIQVIVDIIRLSTPSI